MKIISHRGNLNGREPDSENTLYRIDKCISLGFDVEVDLWKIGDRLFLGHDSPDHEVTIEFLVARSESLWVHCKNLEALSFLSCYDLNYFWHESDTYTLTSGGYIWTYPQRRGYSEFKSNQILLNFTELDSEQIEKYKGLGIYGLCLDFCINI